MIPAQEYSYNRIIPQTLPRYEIQKVEMKLLFSAKAIRSNITVSMWTSIANHNMQNYRCKELQVGLKTAVPLWTKNGLRSNPTPFNTQTLSLGSIPPDPKPPHTPHPQCQMSSTAKFFPKWQQNGVELLSTFTPRWMWWHTVVHVVNVFAVQLLVIYDIEWRHPRLTDNPESPDCPSIHFNT